MEKIQNETHYPVPSGKTLYCRSLGLAGPRLTDLLGNLCNREASLKTVQFSYFQLSFGNVG